QRQGGGRGLARPSPVPPPSKRPSDLEHQNRFLARLSRLAPEPRRPPQLLEAVAASLARRAPEAGPPGPKPLPRSPAPPMHFTRPPEPPDPRLVVPPPRPRRQPPD